MKHNLYLGAYFIQFNFLVIVQSLVNIIHIYKKQTDSTYISMTSISSDFFMTRGVTVLNLFNISEFGPALLGKMKVESTLDEMSNSNVKYKRNAHRNYL